MEAIFDFDINRITDERLTDIMLMPASINEQRYSQFTEIFKDNPQLERVLISCTGGHENFWNKFFTIFKNENNELNIDPSKIVLSGELTKWDLEIYKDIQNIELGTKSVGDISQIIERFPNLKNISLGRGTVSFSDIGNNAENLFKCAQYMKFVNMKGDLAPSDIQKQIDRLGIGEQFAISGDGRSLVNLDRIGEKSKFPEQVSINVSDLSRIGLDNLREAEDEILLVINNVSQLSNEQLQEIQNSGIKIKGVKIFSIENNREQNATYDLPTYATIREKMDELVEGIDINLPDKQKFAEVYKRVCSNILYDTPAAYPQTKAETQYSLQEESNCRNLKNGLLEGKCVCAGYADILRNALAMVNIESQYVTGDVGKERHAWNKVKLDGVWYNSDPTWDATRMRLGKTPTHALQTDEEIKKKGKKTNFNGPECTTSVERREIEELFDEKHLYIGKFKVPTAKDIVSTIRIIGDGYAELGSDIKRMFMGITEKITDNAQKRKPLKLNAPTSKNTNTNEERSSWDLSNWGIESEEFRKETRNIAENTNNNTNKDIEKKDKETEFENNK